MISIPIIIKKRLILSGFLSIFIHVITLSVINKNVIINTKGDKFIPIEVIVNESEADAGESLNEQIKNTLNPQGNPNIDKKHKYQKEKLTEDTEKSIVKQQIKNNQNNRQPKENLKNKKINKLEKAKNNIDKSQMGYKKNMKATNNPEKGSVKGKGKVKITCLDCKRPKYPPQALRRGAEGSPLVKVWITYKGNVVKSVLIRTSGIASIDNAAIQAASESKFYPIKTETTLNIEYNLKIK